MSISTSPSAKYLGQALLWGVLCLGLGIWGAYDLWVTIPRRQAAFTQYQQSSRRLTELQESMEQHRKNGTQPTQQEAADYKKADADLKAVTPGGKAPVQPAKFDKPIQWMYILCLPFAIPAFINLARVLPQRYRLDEHGALHFKGDKEHGSNVWAADEIADIDMSRWMRKSVAWVVRRDGAVGSMGGSGRLKLDAYHHRDLEKIVGALACRFHPEHWDDQARPVKPKGEDPMGGESDIDSDVEASEKAASAT